MSAGACERSGEGGPWHGGRRRHDGFSLLEIVVALGIATTVLATLLPIYWQVAAGTLNAHQQSVGSMLAEQRLEQLRSLAFGYDVTGPGAYARVTDESTALDGERPAEGGPGLAPSPGNTLLVSTPSYVDYHDSSGRWVGAGNSVPPTAAFVRRWAVTPLPSAPRDGLVLQVMVAPVSAERGGPRVDATRRPGDVWLTLCRARVL